MYGVFSDFASDYCTSSSYEDFLVLSIRNGATSGHPKLTDYATTNIGIEFERYWYARQWGGSRFHLTLACTFNAAPLHSYKGN